MLDCDERQELRFSTVMEPADRLFEVWRPFCILVEYDILLVQFDMLVLRTLPSEFSI
jgi:hypothetical protein